MYERLLDELDAKVYYLKDEEGNPLSAGTMIVSVIIDGNKLSWLSIGDSRLYLIRENQIVQVTRDHNYLEALRDLLQNGKITQEQFLAEREKHAALTSYLGIGGVHQYDISAKPFCLNNGDLLVLATDGMYHSVDMQAFLPLCRAELPFMMQQLDAAIRADMQIIRDNATFIVIRYHQLERRKCIENLRGYSENRVFDLLRCMEQLERNACDIFCNTGSPNKKGYQISAGQLYYGLLSGPICRPKQSNPSLPQRERQRTICRKGSFLCFW